MPDKSPVPKKKPDKIVQGLVLSRGKLSKKGKLRKSSREEMEERRQMVMRLRLKGMPYKSIARKLGIGTMTVKRDLERLREDVAEKVTQFERDYALGECLQTYERIHQEAWDQYERCEHASDGRAKFLNLIRAAENDRVKVLMDVGLIGREAVKVTHEHEHRAADNALKGITKDAQQLIAMALLKAQLQPAKEPIRESIGGNGQKLLDIPPEMVTAVPKPKDGGNGS